MGSAAFADEKPRLPYAGRRGHALPWICKRYLRSIVRSLFRDEHVVDMALALPRVGHPDELRAPAQLEQVHRADISHPRLQTADQLLDIRPEWSAMRYASFDSFRHRFAAIGHVM